MLLQGDLDTEDEDNDVKLNTAAIQKSARGQKMNQAATSLHGTGVQSNDTPLRGLRQSPGR